MKARFNVRSMVLLGLLTAVVALFSLTPIGSFPIGPLSITLNIIPIAIAAIALGPVGGLIMGLVFGIFSFLQCFGIGVLSGMGAATLEISPTLTFIQRVVPRALDGFLVGLIFSVLSKIESKKLISVVTSIVSGIVLIGLFLSAMLLICYDKNGKYNMSAGMYKFMTSGLPVFLVLTLIFALGFVLMFVFITKKDLSPTQLSCGIAGFFAAILNTIFFMGALVLLFNHTSFGLDSTYSFRVESGVIVNISEDKAHEARLTADHRGAVIDNALIFTVDDTSEVNSETPTSDTVKYKLSATGENKLNGTTINGSSVKGSSCRFETAKTEIRGLSDGKYIIKIYKKFNYIDKLRSGKSILLFIITAVGINALFEMVISTFFSTAIGTALFKSKLIKVKEKNEQ